MAPAHRAGRDARSFCRGERLANRLPTATMKTGDLRSDTPSEAPHSGPNPAGPRVCRLLYCWLWTARSRHDRRDHYLLLDLDSDVPRSPMILHDFHSRATEGYGFRGIDTQTRILTRLV